MRFFIAILFLLLLLPSTGAQEKDRWRRIITFEDSIVELNLSQVSFGEGNIGRVRFRTTYSKPVPIRGGGIYKSLIETIEFRCAERQYRLVKEEFFDKKGSIINSMETKTTTEWKDIKTLSTMERLMIPACELIKEKR